MQAGWKFALEKYPEVRRSSIPVRRFDIVQQIDSERAVAAGASWGGYAIKYILFLTSRFPLIHCSSWIQGHPEYGFGFKALICHDGVFDSSYNGYATDELFFVCSCSLFYQTC